MLNCRLVNKPLNALKKYNIQSNFSPRGLILLSQRNERQAGKAPSAILDQGHVLIKRK